MVLSSGKLCQSDLVGHKIKSFIKILNWIGPSIEACGTPEIIVLIKINILLISTLCFWCFTKLWWKVTVSKSRPYACSLAIRRSWRVQSNAFDTSIETEVVKRLWPNACLQFSISQIKTWLVLYPLLYADISSDKERFTKGRSCSLKTLYMYLKKN